MALTFWYDFSSSYSYLAALRVEAMATDEGVEVVWQPFLLGPIFAEAGYGGSPNLTLATKAEYMWRDIARRAAHRGEAFSKPADFPQKSVLAARAALAVDAATRPAFSRAVFAQIFAHGEDIANAETIKEAALAAGLSPATVLEQAAAPPIKEALFAAVARAKALGIFGAPSFVTGDGTLFWGDDRLADALHWERTGTLPPNV